MPSVDYRNKILKQKICLFLEGTQNGAYANAVVALATVWLIWDKIPQTQAIVWLSGMLFFSAYRAVASPRNKDLSKLPLSDIQKILNRYLPALAGTGILWGLAAFLLYVADSWKDQSVLIMMLVGIIAASMSTMSSLIKIIYAYILICTVPILLHLAVDSGSTANTFAVLGSIMTLLILQGAKKLHGAIDSSLVLSTQKEELADKLQIAIVKAEEASQTKNEFLANISHEIRTPMNAIIGFGDYLHETPLNEQQSESLSIIRSSSKSLLTLINDILDFTKIESGKVLLEQQTFSIADSAKKLSKIFSYQAEEKKLQLNVELDPKLPSALIGDAPRLNQVLSNLIGNALKFTEKGTITLSIQFVTEMDNRVFLQFNVEDTGIGIPTEKLQNIFYSFEQADNSTTRKYGGTGLGLSITEKLVTLMGGHIQVRSIENQGTIFFFSLPFKVPALASPPNLKPTSNALPSLLGRKVLLVEDNIFNQKIASILVEKMKPEVIQIANNGLEALEFLKKEEYFCVLMDLQMPIMGGIEATAKIRTQAVPVLNPKIPIIALTAHARSEDKQGCMDVGMDDYLSKPYKAEDLYLIFHRLVDQAGPVPTSEEA